HAVKIPLNESQKCFVQLATSRHRHASPALREALQVLREAWTEPRALRERWPTDESSSCENKMWSDAGSPRASPGLLRRRYSMPETVMRKYRLAQQRSDGDEGRSSASPVSSPARGCACCFRRRADPMRKSALLRSWGRASPARVCTCVGTRSLDGSHTELRSRCSRRIESDTCESHRPSSSYAERRASPIVMPSTDRSTDSSDTYSTSMPTTKEVKNQLSVADHIDGRISERSASAENENSNVLPYDRPLVLENPTYDVLEVVVTETIDAHATMAVKNGTPEKTVKSITKNDRNQIDIDEYVSNILVESLNSITDQLESMNASICSDRRLSIVEKEIKVKLQNTGVNTIVHLSPTSNNQIIFGNEELYDVDRCNRNDTCSSNIHEELYVETNNNFTSAESSRDVENNDPHTSMNDHFINATPESVNKAVLQQIQKLFQEDLISIEPEMNSPIGPLPGISHIEISNVDVFIDNNTNSIDVNPGSSENVEVIGGIGTGNYFPDLENDPIVPRFSAFPHTESMEVNTSSSEDAEIFGSDCASLVDSLDDPNSPRSILLRKSYSNHRRNELVRSAIDVLDLLPENLSREQHSPKEKGESFFIKIKDDECECEDKENVVVADYMPEEIKQRLYRRHRKREMRMECARRSRVKQMRRDCRSSREDYKSRKEAEKDCVAIVNALIDEVIAKIAQDEYKCLRIKQRSSKSVPKPEETKRKTKKDSENNNRRSTIRNGLSQSCSNDLDKQHRKTEKPASRKPSSSSTPASPENNKPKRIYQKSEFHDGNKRIEILEILEYVSQSSTETTSDENHNAGVKKKSRIPVPVPEKVQKARSNGNSRSPKLSRDSQEKSSSSVSNDEDAYETPVRRASVPCETRSRSNSLRFRNVFDIIPEERSSLSLESTDDGRRASAPSLNEIKEKKDRSKNMRSTGTSPMPDVYRISVGAMTSPIRKSAGTSPIRVASGANVKRPSREEGIRFPLPLVTAPLPQYSYASNEECFYLSEGSNDRERKREEDSIPAIFRFKREKKERSLPNSTSEHTEEKHVRVRDREKVKRRVKDNTCFEESSSSESSGSLLCALAPAWLNARRRRRKASNAPGEWAVTVAGSCAAALPNDVEMRLRFPDPCRPRHAHNTRPLECVESRGQSRCRRASEDNRLTFTVKKEASDSSILASKSVKKSNELLPNLETFRASRSKTRSSMKTRGCSLHCWLPAETPLARSRDGLSVSGSAIVPERKPRATTMSERDLTRRPHYRL
ncbi:uncharacterized protein LOC121736246, partial [Aricia agestis]|uniref:uncharacterized protein LOC121736246 n=1 Tax=Aricia agestis TaxID=91739 RepID=UPI001C207294